LRSGEKRRGGGKGGAGGGVYNAKEGEEYGKGKGRVRVRKEGKGLEEEGKEEEGKGGVWRVRWRREDGRGGIEVVPHFQNPGYATDLDGDVFLSTWKYSFIDNSVGPEDNNYTAV